MTADDDPQTRAGHTALAPLPHPSGRLPLIGDLLRLDPTRPTQREMVMARELGPIFEIKIGAHPIVIVAGAGPAAKVLDESRFAKALVPPLTKLRDLAGDGLFTAYNSEPNWALAHRILGPSFSQSAMRNYHRAMLGAVEDLCAHWDAATGPVDVSADMNKLALEVIGRAGFDYTFHAFDSDRDPFVDAMTRALGFVTRTSNDVALLRMIFGRRAAAQHPRDIAYLHRTVDDVIARRRSGQAPAHDDLLQAMLDTPDPETGARLDDENIRNQVITFLVAGHETTAGALSFALYHLSRHPEVLARARAEVDALWPPDEPAVPEYEQVAKLRYVRQVISETLRLWPSGPGFFRKAREDTVVGGRHLLRRGQPILVLLLGLHRDPAWGPDPEAFDPDRFTPEQIRRRSAHVYKPFGTGARSCIGRQFALHEATLALALLIRRFDFSGEPGYQLKIQEQLTLKPEGFRLSLRPRR
ncbi:cytochrome P450 [Speluncibacter jeojiensis]|uniref:Cytochrome P450 n=1 Tax=Speluncibacter jeojiensis TaxID=2710754 RepID=A0A9X4RD77_9ACTN|nr:cytochrome P450 [Corynebacteriales bacterium D3-21]